MELECFRLKGEEVVMMVGVKIVLAFHITGVIPFHSSSVVSHITHLYNTKWQRENGESRRESNATTK